MTGHVSGTTDVDAPLSEPVDWLVLLPPSRGVRDGGDGPRWRDTSLADGGHGTARRTAIAAARKLTGDRLVAAIGGRSAVPEARAWLRQIHRAPTMPAVERYAGVVYEHLDVASLPPQARRRAGRHVLIPSALFGPLLGDDPVPAYRLLMAARLPEPVGRLAAFWRPHVADRIGDVLADGATVVDLLSAEYAAAVPAAARRGRHWVTVDVVGTDGRKVPGTVGKQCKGALARQLLLSGEATTEAVRSLPWVRAVEADEDRWRVHRQT